MVVGRGRTGEVVIHLDLRNALLEPVNDNFEDYVWAFNVESKL